MKAKIKMASAGLLILEVALIFSLFSFIPNEVFAAIGNPNANVTTWLKIGNVYPDIVNVSLNGDTSITLTPNETTKVWCAAVVRDYNGETDIMGVNATLYDSSYTSDTADDNNYHYTNSSCQITLDAGTFNTWDTDNEYYVLANCTFDLEYYSNPGTWVCNATAVDAMDWTDTRWNTETVNELLALGVPDLINYTEVNATEVSPEQIANVTNLGNVEINLSLHGYGVTDGDNKAMNCTLGNIGYIPIMYEKYNLSESTATVNSLSEFEATYVNLTGSAVTKQFNLGYRQEDTYNEAWNLTYWRIYVPKGVAGTCNGTIVFGAVVENEL